MRLIAPRPTRISIERSIAFFIAFIGMSVSGALAAFNVYEPAFKEIFQYNQAEVEIISAMGDFGACLAFPIGLFFTYFGPKWTAFLGLIEYTAGYLLMWMSVLLKDYFSTSYGWQCVFVFITGQGSLCTYMACLMTTMNNYPLRLRGTVIGIIEAMYGGSGAIFAAIYGNAFINHNNARTPENQNLKGYFLMCAIIVGIVNLMAILGLKLLPPEETQALDINLSDSIDADRVSLIEMEEMNHEKDLPVSQEQKPRDVIFAELGGLRILINLDFQYLFWIANIAGGVSLMYMNNISTILASFHITEHNVFLSTLTPIASCVSRVISGFISDRLAHKVPRAVILLFCLILLAVMQFISIFYLDGYVVIVINSIVMGASNGCLWCLTPIITSELFGTKNFGWNWGWMMLSTSIGTFIYQRVFAAIYQFYIRPGNGLYCDGIKCYRWTFVFTAVTTLYAIILTIRLIQRINNMLNRNKSSIN